MLRNKMAPILFFPAIAVWGAGVLTGLGAIHSYESRPGTTGKVPPSWPANSRIRFNSAHTNLILFAHPRCPCTRASITTLAQIMDRCSASVSAQVLFFLPAKGKDEWERTELWRRAAAIPGVQVRGDLEGVEASLFGAKTSGTVVLYDQGGRLLFRGGITEGRGQFGENAGADAVIAHLSHETRTRSPGHPVFGCSILGNPIETEGGRGQRGF